MEKGDQETADARFLEALATAGARDPRDYYRDRLKDLKENNPEAYSTAVGHYKDTLIPSIAAGSAEPLAAWRDYGLRIAHLTAVGRTMEIDTGGNATPYSAPGDPAAMVLHLPDEVRIKALLVALPPSPSPAQMATYDWLVVGKKGQRNPA